MGSTSTTRRTAAATSGPATPAVTGRRRRTAKPEQLSAGSGPDGGESAGDLRALGARVVSVYGMFGERTLVEMPTKLALEMFPRGLVEAGRAELADAVLNERERLRSSAPDLADGALAAMASAMALEVEHPFNSATSKSMCAGKLQDALRELRELAPPQEEADGIDDIAEQRAKRRARLPGAAT